MSILAVALLAIAIGDLVAGGLPGTPGSFRRSLLGSIASAAVIAVGLSWAAPFESSTLWTAVHLGLASTAWLVLRVRWGVSARRRSALDWLAVLAMAYALSAASIHGGLLTGSTATVAESPLLSVLPPLDRQAERSFLMAGLFLFLAPTGNGLVRLVLSLAGTQVGPSEQRLRGGRFIGILERWLIFGLAVAGEPTAAALIASAKSLLRFPELTSISRSTAVEVRQGKLGEIEIDTLTEYLLLGSLASWTLALAAVPVWVAGSGG